MRSHAPVRYLLEERRLHREAREASDHETQRLAPSDAVGTRNVHVPDLPPEESRTDRDRHGTFRQELATHVQLVVRARCHRHEQGRSTEPRSGGTRAKRGAAHGAPRRSLARRGGSLEADGGSGRHCWRASRVRSPAFGRRCRGRQPQAQELRTGPLDEVAELWTRFLLTSWSCSHYAHLFCT